MFIKGEEETWKYQRFWGGRRVDFFFLAPAKRCPVSHNVYLCMLVCLQTWIMALSVSLSLCHECVMMCYDVSWCVLNVSWMCNDNECVIIVSWCVMDVSWMCHGCVMTMSWMCHESVMKVSWICHEFVMNFSRIFEESRKSHGRVKEELWKSHGKVMEETCNEVKVSQ